MAARRIGRRTFLRGAGGVAVALPALEIMLDESGTAYADGSSLPCRYFCGFGGFSLRADNGNFEFRPDSYGPGYDLKPSAAPLGDYGDVSREITIVSGLRIPHQAVDGGQVQPGGSIGFHWHGNPLLTGNRQIGSSVNATVTGPSTDRIVAEALGSATAYRSLNYRAQAGFYIVPSGVDVAENRDTMSFDAEGTPVAPTVSPRLAYESLFTGFDPSAAGQFALRKRQSVLDLVERRTHGVLASLGAADRQRMDQHYTQIRELEMRLEAAEDLAACTPPAHPGDDPPLSGNFSGPTCSGGVYDPSAGYSGEYERARLLSDFIAMAFACDLTRVACLMVSMFQSFMNAAPLGGENRDVHATYHLGQASGVVPVVAWHMDQFAYFVSRLRDTPEGDGSVLDNAALVFMIEGGAGMGPGGSESHTLDQMCWLVAGGAGGLRRGEHIAAPAGRNHPVNVLITAMNAVGVDTPSVGEVSGSIPELLV